MKSTFEVLIGCRQGGQESPVLFNYYFDFVLKIAACEIDKAFPNGWGLEFKFNIPNVCSNREQREEQKLDGIQVIQWILYADDIVLFARNIDEVQKLLHILNSTCKRYGLNISWKKTKTQVFNDPSKELAEKPTLVNIDGNDIENVKEFVYLGHVFSNNGIEASTEHRISRANAKFQQLREVLCDFRVNKNTRWKILEACVVPRLLYGLQACSPPEQQLKKLEACWFQLLHSMIRGGWKRVSSDPENPDFRFVYTNKDLERILRTKSIRGMQKSGFLKYHGHVCRERNTAITKKMMFADSQKLYHNEIWKKLAKENGIDRIQLLKKTQKRGDFREFAGRHL